MEMGQPGTGRKGRVRNGYWQGKTCQTEDCEKPIHARGFCRNHYNWELRQEGKFLDSERKAHLRKKYGISIEEYDAMFEKQKGLCRICNKPETAKPANGTSRSPRDVRHLAVDHCHDTGKVRGLLCYKCNMAVGFLQNDPALFEAGFKYLQSNVST